MTACATAGRVQPIANPPITGVYTASEMSELLRQWKTADGESVFVVSDRLADFLSANPRQFYPAMKDHPEALDRWLRNLGGTTFTDFGHSCVDRRCLREQMIRSVERNPADEPTSEEVRSRILKVLRETEVRTVD